jgi:hypothetical protein
MRQLLSLITLLLATTAILSQSIAIDRTVLTPPLIAIVDSAQRGDAKSQYRVAMLLERGYGTIERDSLEALRLYTLSAENGYAPAQNYMGFLYYNATEPQRDLHKALAWIQRAADSGDAKACNNLGWMLSRGDGVVCDYEKAAYWYGKAAEAGLPVAKAQLADLYRQGLGVERDTTTARHLYEEAIAAGFTDAQYPLMEMMDSVFQQLDPQEAADLGVRYRSIGAFEAAVRLFEQGAEAENADALTMLANAYSRSEGVEYSHAKSLEYFLRGALAGNDAARHAIAELLEMFPDAFSELPASLADRLSPEMYSPEYWQ